MFYRIFFKKTPFFHNFQAPNVQFDSKFPHHFFFRLYSSSFMLKLSCPFSFFSHGLDLTLIIYYLHRWQSWRSSHILAANSLIRAQSPNIVFHQIFPPISILPRSPCALTTPPKSVDPAARSKPAAHSTAMRLAAVLSIWTIFVLGATTRLGFWITDGFSNFWSLLPSPVSTVPGSCSFALSHAILTHILAI